MKTNYLSPVTVVTENFTADVLCASAAVESFRKGQTFSTSDFDFS